MSTNSDIVMGIYAAFGSGDVGHILEQMSDDIAWDEGIRATSVTYLQPGSGKGAVIAFFTALAENLEFTTFEPSAPCAAGDTVMVAVREASRNLRTGATLDEDTYVHIWTFGPDGKVAAFRHVGDWARHESAAAAASSMSSSGAER